MRCKAAPISITVKGSGLVADSDTKVRHTASEPLSKEDYLAATTGPQPGFVATLDGVDANRGATVQAVVLDPSEDHPYAGVSVQAPSNDTPGQVFATFQLPDPQAAVVAGFPPVSIPAHLIEDDESPVEQGPDPLDLLTRDHRVSLGNPTLGQDGLVAQDEVADNEASKPKSRKKADEAPTESSSV